MTEITEYDASTEGNSSLIAWARDAREAYQIAQSLAKTSFVSSTMKGKAEEITGAILTGAEVGLQPMSALRSIDIIQGTPAMRAVAMRALVLSAGHEVWVEKQTDTEAVVCGQRRGSERVQRSVWTIERARKLGLAEKDNYKKQPSAMLVARATAEVCRLVGADLLLGLPYAVEELEDDDALAETKPKRAKRQPLEPASTEVPALEPPAEPTPEAPEVVAGPPADWPEVALPADADV
jgi:hypothetical protein